MKESRFYFVSDTCPADMSIMILGIDDRTLHWPLVVTDETLWNME